MNRMAIAQLRGITSYEFRMHWRRRALLAVTLGMLVMLVFNIAVLGSSLSMADGLDPAVRQQAVSATIIFSTWAPMGVSLAFILPVIIADTIPLDRQYGVRDLLDSMPLSGGIYLTGKLLGTWAAVLAGMIVIMIASSLIWWLFAGAYDLLAYLEMWLIGVAWVSILNGGLGVLIGAGQPNRRRGITVVILFLFISAFLLNGSFQGGNWQGIVSPTRGALLTYYLFNVRQGIVGETVVPAMMTTPDAVLLTIVAGIVELGLIWLVMRRWMKWRELS